MAVDHEQARAHIARELEGRAAGSNGERRERVAQVLDASHGLDTSLELRRLTVAAAEVAKVEVTAARRGEEELRARVAR